MFLAGPYAGMLLADMGAEVVKVEPVGTGDPFRGWEHDGYSPTFCSVNRNKKSVAVDLKSPAGCEVLQKLIARADVLIQNFRPDAARAARHRLPRHAANQSPADLLCDLGLRRNRAISGSAGVRHGGAGDGRAAGPYHGYGIPRAGRHFALRPRHRALRLPGDSRGAVPPAGDGQGAAGGDVAAPIHHRLHAGGGGAVPGDGHAAEPADAWRRRRCLRSSPKTDCRWWCIFRRRRNSGRG